MARINSKPRLRLRIECGRGRGIHMSKARVRAAVGVVRNRNWEEKEGRTGSLVNSLSPSAMGCRRPYGPTTFGPLRCCM